MKTLEELADKIATLPSDITDLETIIFSDVQKVMLEECLGLSLVHTTSLQGKATDFIRVPKELSPLSPLPTAAEGTIIVPRKFLMDTKDITLSQRWGDAFSLSRDAIEDSESDLITLAKDNMAKEFAQGLDDYLFSILLRETLYTAESHAGGAAHTVYTLTHKPITRIIAVTDDSSPVVPVTLEAIDEYDGKVKIAENLTGKNLLVTYDASSHTLVEDAITDQALAFGDLSEAYDMARAHSETPKIVVVSSRAKSDIIKDTRFLEAYLGTGKQAPVSTFEIGMAAGMKIVVSNKVPEGVAFIIDPTRFVWHVEKGGVKVTSRDDVESDTIDFFFFLRAGADVVDQYAAVLITNLGSLSADL